MKIEILKVGNLETNCYLCFDPKNSGGVVIDPGDDGDFIVNKIKDLNLKLQAILLTHGHFDHVLAVTEIKTNFPKVPIYLAIEDLSIYQRAEKTATFFIQEVSPQLYKKPDVFLNSKNKIKFGNFSFQVLFTPGHTKGSVCFYEQKEKVIFVGDLIFKAGGYGRTDLEGGNLAELKKSLKKILNLDKKTFICPGHGEITTVEQERQYWDA